MKLASTPIKIREIMAARRAPLKVFKPQRSTQQIPVLTMVSSSSSTSDFREFSPGTSTVEVWCSDRTSISVACVYERGGARKYTLTIRDATPMKETDSDTPSHFPETTAPLYPQTYPSVTTILERMLDKSGIEEWRDAVGHEYADAYTTAACKRGSSVHAMIECYVRLEHDSSDQINRANFLEAMASFGRTPEELTIFHLLRQHIDTFDNFEGVEVLIYHPKHKYAGRIDLIGRRGDKLVLIDIKTYGKQRSDEHLLSAKLQTTLYAIAMRDVYDVHIDEVEIVYANPTSGLQVVPVDVASYESEAIELTTKHEMLYA